MKIWIDLDNSPHVPFFIPIIEELEKNGHSVFLSTRDCFQVCSLADFYHLKHRTVGTHYGSNKFLKVLGTLWRSLQLAPIILKEKPKISISHGSRALIILSALLRIPTIVIFDYEYSKSLPFLKPALGIAPAFIDSPEIATQFKLGLRGYQGLKEDIYASTFKPDPSILKNLGLKKDDLIVTIRPPATEAHYHNPESETLFFDVVEYLGSVPELRMVILPRNEKTQRDLIYDTWPQWCKKGKIIIPDHALNGLDLIWYSDMVISGGGTMNREAASLGIPVYSIFRGRIGAVDRYLAKEGRLTLIETPADIKTKIKTIRRHKGNTNDFHDRTVFHQIMASIDGLINA